MNGAALHAIFDVAAWLSAGVAICWLSRVRGLQFPSQSFELPYLAALMFGAGLGAYLFGTLNLWLSGAPAPVKTRAQGRKSVTQCTNKPLFFGVF
jgi:phosphatidylglycerol---prolipoprotein diacylglyceryl transferase